MKSKQEEPQNNKEEFPDSRRPYFTGKSDTDWGLWQLAQVLKEIAQTSLRKEDESNRNGDK